MAMDYKELQFWLAAANSVWMFAVTVYTWRANKSKEVSAALQAINKSLIDDRLEIEKRFGAIDTEMAKRLTHDDLAPVYEKVNDAAQALSALEGQLTGMNTNLMLIHDHLLNGGNKK